MRIIGLRDAKQTLSECIDEAQEERMLITRHGKPAAIVIGVAGQDMEEVLLQMDPKFWQMIESRRLSSSTVSLEEVRKRYGLAPNKRKRRRSSASSRQASARRSVAPACSPASGKHARGNSGGAPRPRGRGIARRHPEITPRTKRRSRARPG